MNAPDRIWATGGNKGGDWGSRNGLCHTFGGTEYIRRDPGVLAALPEIKALIDAVDYIVDGMGISYPDYEIDPDEDYLDAANAEWVKDTLNRLAAALRAITESKG